MIDLAHLDAKAWSERQFVLPLNELFAKKGKPIIYKAVNKVNGKIYIGITIVGLSDRKSKHFYYAESGGKGKFSAAIRKYGRDNFDFSVLAVCKNLEEARAEERNLISMMKPEYNLTRGGEGVWGRRHSEETRVKMSERAKARKNQRAFTKEDIERSLAARAKNKSHRVRDAAHLASLQEICRKMQEMRSKSVICLTDEGKKFASLSGAARYYDILPANISRSCRKRRATSKGKLRFAWGVEL